MSGRLGHHLKEARVLTKLDLKEAYNRINVAERDEWRTAFRTSYGHFEYLVIRFGLTNAPAQFQELIAQPLVGMPDLSCVVGLDDTLLSRRNMTVLKHRCAVSSRPSNQV